MHAKYTVDISVCVNKRNKNKTEQFSEQQRGNIRQFREKTVRMSKSEDTREHTT